MRESAKVEPAWLDGYSGQTVDELLAFERTHRIDSLVLAFERVIGQKAARDGEDSLTTEEKTVLAVEALEREVNHGGFHQFFSNTTEFVPEIVPALRRIGCPEVASIMEVAIAAMRLPAVSVGEVENVIYDDDDERDSALGECDQSRSLWSEHALHEAVMPAVQCGACRSAIPTT